MGNDISFGFSGNKIKVEARFSKRWKRFMVVNSLVNRWFTNGLTDLMMGIQLLMITQDLVVRKTCSNQENIKIISNILDKDRRVTLRQLEEELGMSKSILDKILTEQLGMSRVLSRWVPKLLSESQRIERVRVCRQLLRISKEPRFFDRLVTGDETWLHFYEPKTCLQMSQWKRRHEATPIRPRAVASAGKRMATVFWDTKGIIIIDWLPNKVAINTEYYVQVLKKLREAIKFKRRGKLSSHVLLQHDNAPAHTSRRTLDEIQHLGFELLPHPPYSPDLAPRDYWLFSEMKRPLRGKRFSDFEHLRSAVNSWIQGIPEKFTTGINKLPSNGRNVSRLGRIY
ncbi:Transposase [Oopsacas minuta]|uniref:Transposase n=1 Tax=Oopsacas minuta TaxID=111878 RepID=A0AAV7JW33_9METZ|nr:Transposase [Oopsacas minuta]